jgi:hypothetical protein
MGWQALVAAMERCGATEPPPEVVLVKVKVREQRKIVRCSMK